MPCGLLECFCSWRIAHHVLDYDILKIFALCFTTFSILTPDGESLQNLSIYYILKSLIGRCRHYVTRYGIIGTSGTF